MKSLRGLNLSVQQSWSMAVKRKLTWVYQELRLEKKLRLEGTFICYSSLADQDISLITRKSIICTVLRKFFLANNFFVCANSARSVQCHIFNEMESKVQNGSHCWQLFLQGVWWSVYCYAWERLKQGMGTAGPHNFTWQITSIGCRANQQRSWGRERNSLHGRPRVFQYHEQIGVSGVGYLTRSLPLL